MRKFLAQSVGAFIGDERGVFLPLFGVMAVVVIAMGGAVVDYVRVDSARKQAQLALDATTLALQSQIYNQSPAQLQTLAQAYLVSRINDDTVNAQIEAVKSDTETGTIALQAKVTLPMTFLELVGIKTLSARVISQATRKKINLEVAFVLDNSGSMSWDNRMSNLKSAANCATNIIFYGSCNPPSGATKAPNVKAGVVPFNIFVNVGYQNAAASWMDGGGISSIANDNFDDDDNDATPFAGPVNRFELYNSMSNVSWQGCVETRPYPLSVNDAAPDPANPDTLFVPEFAPDEPDSGRDGGYFNNYLNDDPQQCQSYQGQCSRTATGSRSDDHEDEEESEDEEERESSTTYAYRLERPDGSYETGSTTATCSCPNNAYPCSYYGSTNLSDRERQERLCKYSGASVSGTGPNANCVNTSILPLTDQPSSVLSRINSMTAQGGTNIQAGAIWGYRVLSPGAPFSEGQAYDTGTSKVIILMTDGENTFYAYNNMNGSAYYYPFGYLWNTWRDQKRIGSNSLSSNAQVAQRMDTMTVESCNAAKRQGIVVYTIGLNPPSQTTKDMLTACASDATHAYFPTDPSQLNAVFVDIAGQLADLRIER